MSCKYCSHSDYRARGFCSIECRRFFEYEKEIAELKAALANIQAVAVNNLDHDMHRVYKMCDEVLVLNLGGGE